MVVKKSSKQDNDKLIVRKTCSMQLSSKCKNEHEDDTKRGRKETDFYMVINNNLFKSKKVHICKDCIKEYIYRTDGSVNLNKFKKVLLLLDIPFYQKEFDSAVEGQKETFGTYYKNIALNHLGEGWDNGEISELKEAIENSANNELETRGFWGSGFDYDEYEFLEDELARWKQTHKCDTQAEATLLREICITILDIRNARKMGTSTKELRKELQELMKTASVDPAKANAISGGQTVDRFGVWLKDIEQKKPSEWWDDQEKYKDMDGFLPYIKNYILRPIKNFFTGVKDFVIDGEDLSFKDKDE